MKKLLSLVMCVIMLASVMSILAGCTDDTTTGTTTTTTTTTTTAVVQDETTTTTTSKTTTTTKAPEAVVGRENWEDLVDDFITAMCTGDAQLAITLLHPDMIAFICDMENLNSSEFLAYVEDEYGTGTDMIAQIADFSYEMTGTIFAYGKDKINRMNSEAPHDKLITEGQEVKVVITLTYTSGETDEIRYGVDMYKCGGAWYLFDIDG